MIQTYSELVCDAVVSGFRTSALYRNGSGQAIGARFYHLVSGLQLDLIEIQTVPQVFVTVHTFPVSNMGEPHTQEHLLLGKGNVGRAVAARETMSMIESTAYTQQLKTCYPFAANAGIEAFFDHFERYTYALLYPDYTDEEIRREVRNFGVRPGPDGSLELEEKGTIYTEMQSSSSQPGYRAYRAMGRLLLGTNHPMSYDSGGDPTYIRDMQADDIRRFHAANYHLANMEMIASLPKGLALADALARFDGIFTRLQGDRPVRPGTALEDLPTPNPAIEGTTSIVGFPSRNTAQPAPAQIAWPLAQRLDPREEGLADLFAQAFGGDPSTNLYKLFIDSRTRKTELGARTIALGFDNEVFSNFYVYIPDLPADQATEARLNEITALVQEELRRVAAFEDGSAELREFHERMEANLVRMRRSADKLISSPPGFGGRMSQSIWPGLLRDLNLEPGFDKDLTQPELFAWLESMLASGTNLWRDRIAAWGLIDTKPYAVAAKATPGLIEEEEAALAARLKAETERLMAAYSLPSDAAIARFAAEYDAATDELERVKSLDTPARFIDSPPMTLDDQLDYTLTQIAGTAPLVTGYFAGMNSATVGLLLDATSLTGDELLYAALLPTLLTGTGLIKDGETISHEDVIQRVRREILGLSASWSSNPTTGRVELGFVTSGNTLEEAHAALGWLRATLFSPLWTADNLSRVRDLIDQSLNALRGTMQRSEENWVQGPAMSWTYQNDPLYVALGSFHAQMYQLHRLRCRFAEPGPADISLLEQDLPENSREADRAHLLAITEADLQMDPATALAELNNLRLALLRRGGARLHLTASPEHAAALLPAIEALVLEIPEAAARPPRQLLDRPVAARMKQRYGIESEPRYVGLLAPSMAGGVHLHSVPGIRVTDLDTESGLRFLAYRLFTGGGPHGIFMKTWAAGLAYSNGLRASAFEGRNHYYAERCPDLAQTMKFVVTELKASPRNAPLAEYTLAQVFAGTRAGSGFESRTAAMAADLADNWGPEVVRAFRAAILALRNRPNLDAELYERMDALYATVLPGYGETGPLDANSTYYVIGPEKQIAAWEQYVGEPVYRLYARDYWSN